MDFKPKYETQKTAIQKYISESDFENYLSPFSDWICKIVTDGTAVNIILKRPHKFSSWNKIEAEFL